MKFINFISKLIIILLVHFHKGVKASRTTRIGTETDTMKEICEKNVAIDTHTFTIYASAPLLSHFGKLANL